MTGRSLATTNPLFVLVSFEGPDRYSLSGGLGVRVSGLASTLATLGHETHVFFVGDPWLAGEERAGEHLYLHRWSQWISRYCPEGVYQHEEAKVDDFTRSIPGYLLQNIVRPALQEGRTAVVLFEEWQTAGAAIALADLLNASGARDRVAIFWNANNAYGFHTIDWPRLAAAVSISAVSRYMRSIIRAAGADAVVIPNGIPDELLRPVPRAEVRVMRETVDAANARLFFKMARWEREKGWAQALDAVATVRARGDRALLVARAGGLSGQPVGLEQAAHSRGLRATRVRSEPELRSAIPVAIAAGCEVVTLDFGVMPALSRTLYAAADAVLANSISEPFGLVGLEAMAAGGIAYTGGTGEDYAISGRNAIVLESLDPMEIVARCDWLARSPEKRRDVRREARRTARAYVWSRTVSQFLDAAEQEITRHHLHEPGLHPLLSVIRGQAAMPRGQPTGRTVRGST